MDTHTYISCTENASSLRAVAILFYASEATPSGFVMTSRPEGEDNNSGKSSLNSPQSNVQCNSFGTVGVSGLNYYATYDYGYVNGALQVAYNNYPGAFYSCNPPPVPAIDSPTP